MGFFGGGDEGQTAQQAGRSKRRFEDQQNYQNRLGQINSDLEKQQNELGATAQEQAGIEDQSARRSLAGQLAGIKTASNARGLLHSGLRGAAENQAVGDYTGAQSAGRMDINQRLSDRLKQMRDQNINSGFAYDQAVAQENQAGYENKKQKNSSENALKAGLLGSVGGIAGALL